MSRVQVRHSMLCSITGWLLLYTVRSGTYLYQILTLGGTNIFANHDDILKVKEVGETNSFLYGYNPTRSMDVFDSVTAATPSTPHRPGEIPPIVTTPVAHRNPMQDRLVSPLPDQIPGQQATSQPHTLFCQECSQTDDDNNSQLHDDDRSQHQHQGRHQTRPLQNNEYLYPIGNAITRLHEDKIEDLHSSLKTVLSDTTMICPFYDALCRRLKVQHIPLREWKSLAPGVDLLEINPRQCANYTAAHIVMSRAIFNLLDASRDRLITYLFLKGELSMCDNESDGFGFLSYMIS